LRIKVNEYRNSRLMSIGIDRKTHHSSPQLKTAGFSGALDKMSSFVITPLNKKLNDNLADAMDDIKAIMKDLHNQLRRVDRDINDINHVLEYIRVDAVRLTKITIKLRNLFIDRRKIKESVSYFQGLQTDFTKMNKKKVNGADDSYVNKNSLIRAQQYEQEARVAYNRLFLSETTTLS